MKLIVDWKHGTASSLTIGGKEILNSGMPLFMLGLRDADGRAIRFTAADGHCVGNTENSAVYDGFPEDLSIRIGYEEKDGIVWHFAAENRSALMIEWVRIPCLALKPLKDEGGSGQILFPYNEGALIDSAKLYTPREPEYPSLGAYGMYPNMVFGSFLCYMAEGYGLYLAAEDPARGPKLMDFAPEGDGVTLRLGIFCGAEYGAGWELPFPLVMKEFEGNWEDGAALYRDWTETCIPGNMARTQDDPEIPDWYKESPLVVGYPVRGIHDMDEMKPNALFPYGNVLPVLHEIREKTDWPVMALLMHWEGTAPWAPPYVWPPYGGEDSFNAFADALHAEGNLLGVYCSGFGYTLQSNLIESYNKEGEFRDRHLTEAMCTAPDHHTQESRICTAQRRGLDICVGSERGRELLNEAYAPLFASKADYAQILDQNHGGGQYFCYDEHHGHAPGPGPWMTETMQGLLAGWRKAAPDKLFGCESAAGEPYIPFLRFSDNRYELNWLIGRPVPAYAFVFHEYLRNFMGNQVCCGLSPRNDTLVWRMAYSFVAGDSMTFVLLPDGRFLSDWGTRDFEHLPDRERAMAFARNMRKLWDAGAKDCLLYGRMEKPLPVECASVVFDTTDGRKAEMEAVLTSRWSLNGKLFQLFVNPTDEEQTAVWNGRTLRIAPLSGCIEE